MDDTLPNDASQTPIPASSFLIAARDIYKGFKNGGMRIDIFKGADLSLKKGETVAVVGASGIGKSTLLHIIGTLDPPDSGALLFKGRDVLRFNHRKLAEFRNRSIGFVFQLHHLLAEFTALENTMLPALIQGCKKHRAAEAAQAVLTRVGLDHRLHHRAGKLSGGEQQRVALARALVLKPDLLLADEPTGNLDNRNSQQIHNLLLELNNEMHMTLVVVTHNMALASRMSRKMTISAGKLVETN